MYITQPLSDRECLEGETVSFVCVVSKPGVPVTWTKDNYPITEEDGIDLVADGCTHVLRISPVMPEHDSIYAIKVDGSKSIAKLFVEGMFCFCPFCECY